MRLLLQTHEILTLTLFLLHSLTKDCSGPILSGPPPRILGTVGDMLQDLAYLKSPRHFFIVLYILQKFFYINTSLEFKFRKTSVQHWDL